MNCTDAEDLIYNRFDLIYECADEIRIENYKFQVTVQQQTILLNVWGKYFPQEIFDEAVRIILQRYPKAFYIQIAKSYNNYGGHLHKTEDIILHLPKGEDELLIRLKSKHRYNLNRSQRLLEETVGELSFRHIGYCDIDDEVVEQYFEWKQKTHGTDYNLSSKEYLSKYHVTDAGQLLSGDKVVGIIFYCKVNRTVYLENLSYDIQYEKYSPGFLTYTFFLKKLIEEGCELLYLGGGNYTYKKRFDTVEYTAYTGRIYTDNFFEMLNRYMEKECLLTYAIYGLGECGKCFLVNVNRIKGKFLGGIDKEKKYLEGFTTYVWEEEEMPMADIIFITMASHIKEIKDELKNKYINVYYWDEMIALIQNV